MSYYDDYDDEPERYTPDNDYDDYDYEREAYYALGGSDYEAFCERGGTIDDMLDYLGY
jgi:hypothetical protein